MTATFGKANARAGTGHLFLSVAARRRGRPLLCGLAPQGLPLYLILVIAGANPAAYQALTLIN
ncbi:hypothetical protein [Chelatococcus asaccharovorans]|uniref:hypothetical protein n=1 Tax=Chelatococcus asaccharovorans TaxID=28210 RepID=UPI00224C6BB4|nr:hypothetical protein [Chelatococcus asaccharovorans]CAH1648602.1 hypothetical protein CHELA40_10075 [Chelatococcus asaccharovorans]CAH1687564.1 hypothetical protein CHELA17_65532 [Chelatococcus asaccharovorans]